MEISRITGIFFRLLRPPYLLERALFFSWKKTKGNTTRLLYNTFSNELNKHSIKMNKTKHFFSKNHCPKHTKRIFCGPSGPGGGEVVRLSFLLLEQPYLITMRSYAPRMPRHLSLSLTLDCQSDGGHRPKAQRITY